MDFLDEDSELDDIESKQANAALLKSTLSGLGGVMQSQADVPSAYEYMYNKKMPPTDFQGTMDRTAAGIGDPMERKKKAYEYLKQKRENKLANEADLPASAEMVNFYEGAVPSMKGKFGNLTGTQLKAVSPLLMAKFNAEGDDRRARDAAGARSQDRQDRLNDKKELLAEKKAEKMQGLAVPGYKMGDQVVPKAEEAQKFRKATAVSNQLKQKLNRMKDLVKQHGSFEYGGDGGQEMEALATEIQLLGKSPELYELGVLAGPDLTLLNKITASPDSWSSMFTRDKTRQTQLDTQLKSIEQKLSTTAESMGYTPEGKKSELKRQVNKKTRETRIVYTDGTSEIIPSTAGR